MRRDIDPIMINTIAIPNMLLKTAAIFICVSFLKWKQQIIKIMTGTIENMYDIQMLMPF